VEAAAETGAEVEVEVLAQLRTEVLAERDMESDEEQQSTAPVEAHAQGDDSALIPASARSETDSTDAPAVS